MICSFLNLDVRGHTLVANTDPIYGDVLEWDELYNVVTAKEQKLQ